MKSRFASQLGAGALALAPTLPLAAASGQAAFPAFAQVDHRSVINGVKIAYREAGDPTRPTILLLHGFPTSSHMFRNLIPALRWTSASPSASAGWC